MKYPSRATAFVIAINLGIGLLRALEPRTRYLSPVYAAAKVLMPVTGWGIMFVTLAGMLFLLRDSEIPLRLVAGFTGLAWFLWGSLSALSVHTQNQGNICHTAQVVGGCHYAASYGGAALYYFVAAVHSLIVLRLPLPRVWFPREPRS